MYKVMHKDTVVAKANEDRITEIVHEELCPACFFEGASLEMWLKSRSIDVHRSHSRQLYKALRLKSDSDISDIINIGHGISITDNWWIQKDTDHLDYTSLKEYNEDIANIALYGSSRNSDYFVKGYTELGTLGSYEKAWKYINGTWYMYKQGNKAELISEYYAYQFLKNMDMPIADYEVLREQTELGLLQECIITKDFTQNAKYDFEPFLNYFNDNEDHEYIITRLKQIEEYDSSLSLAESYVKMCFYDALLFNVDRHNGNAGFLRDSHNGNILSLAPCYDYNLSLAATKTPHFNPTGDLMKYFVESKQSVEIMKPILPTKEEILSAAEKAAESTSEAFSNENFKYSIFEAYIENAYDYYTDKISR